MGFGVSEINDEPCRICKQCPLNNSYEKPEPKRKRKFTWNTWNYDGDGEAYIIGKAECAKREDVPEWIVKTDHLDHECLNPAHGAYIAVEDVYPGWCKYQIRTDWEDCDGESTGGYFVEDGGSRPVYSQMHKNPDKRGNPIPGWFPVWIVRKGEWY